MGLYLRFLNIQFMEILRIEMISLIFMGFKILNT